LRGPSELLARHRMAAKETTMASVSQSILIERPAAAVFSAIEDPKVQMTFDDMFRGVDQFTDGPIGKGVRVRTSDRAWVRLSCGHSY
jgi:hypothetical protein